MWLHPVERLEALATKDDPRLRRWALATWRRCYPDEGAERRAKALVDDDPRVVAEAAAELVARGDAWVRPVLQHALTVLDPAPRTALLSELSDHRDPELVPLLVDRLRRPSDGREVLAVLRALTGAPTPLTATALLPLLEQLDEDDALAAHVAGGLLLAGGRDAVRSVVARWRTLPLAERSGIGGAVARWLGVPSSLGQLLHRVDEDGPEGLFDAIEEATGVEEPLDDALLDRLASAWASRGPAGVLRELPGLFTRWMVAHGIDPRPWYRAELGRPFEDTRAAVVGVDTLLNALAVGDHDDPERALREAHLALLVFASALLRTDAVGRLEGATDPAEVAWAVLGELRAVPDPVALATVLSNPRRVRWALARLEDDELPLEVHQAALAALATVPDPAETAVRLVLRFDATPALGPDLVHTLVGWGEAAVPALVDRADDPGAVPHGVIAALGRLPTADSVACLQRVAARHGLAPVVQDALAGTGAPEGLTLFEADPVAQGGAEHQLLQAIVMA